MNPVITAAIKKIATIVFFFIIILQQPVRSLAQAPGIQWNKLFGGTGYELVSNAMIQTSDGGYILAGATYSSQSGSISGIKHGGPGDTDIWIVKTDAAGNKEWDKLLGGENSEEAFSIQQTTDGGYILAGSSGSSETGDVTGVTHGGEDVWIVKLDATGNIQWDKLLGGTGYEGFESVVRQTSDGGYIFTAYSYFDGGDMTGTNHGGEDVWIVKLDATGNKLWDKLMGGTGDDYVKDIRQTTDGGYIFVGSSASSQSGDVSGINHANGPSFPNDAWVVRLDAGGNKLWDKLMGGTGGESAASIQLTSDGGYIMGGTSTWSSQDGDISGINHAGYNDYWIVKLDAAGNKVWDKLLGGSLPDALYCIRQTTDGGYIAVGGSESNANGDITEPHHGQNQIADIWVVKLDATGNKKWDKVLGSIAPENNPTIQQTSDGGFIISANTGGDQDGDVTAIANGNFDYWLVKLAPEPASGALPLTMLSFTAVQQNEKILLNWSTGTEQGTKDFIVQRSADGITWSNIGNVQAAGNSSTVTKYKYLDAQPADAINQYRLLQRDLDGKSAISETKIVYFNGTITGFRLLGNPGTNGLLQLELKKPGIVTVVNMQGITIFKKQLTAGKQYIRLGQSAKGLYSVKAGDDVKVFVLQ